MHINSNDLNNFQNEEMNTDEIIAFLEHMKHCDYCLNQLADEYTDHASSAPAYLKETIMERVTAPDIQIQKTAADATYKMWRTIRGQRDARSCRRESAPADGRVHPSAHRG